MRASFSSAFSCSGGSTVCTIRSWIASTSAASFATSACASLVNGTALVSPCWIFCWISCSFIWAQAGNFARKTFVRSPASRCQLPRGFSSTSM